LSDWAGLLTATCLAGLRLVWGIVRDRTMNPFATVMISIFGVGLALSLVTGDPRLLLVVKSLVTGAIGLVFLVSTSGAQGRQPRVEGVGDLRRRVLRQEVQPGHRHLVLGGPTAARLACGAGQQGAGGAVDEQLGYR
jgi:hypothetical protein